MSKWETIYNFKHVNYEKIRLFTKKFHNEIIINNNLHGNKIQICLSNTYGNSAAIIENLSCYLLRNNQELSLQIQDDVQKLFIDSFSIKKLFSIEREIFPCDKIKISYDIINNNLNNGILIANSNLIDVKTKGIIESKDSYFRNFLDIPDKYCFLFYLSEVKVLSDSNPLRLCFFGDSHVQFPFWISTFVQNLYEKYSNKISISNYGISGNRLIFDTPLISPDVGQINGIAAINRFEDDVFGKELKPNLCIIMEGINDVILPFEYRCRNEFPDIEKIKQAYIYMIKTCYKYNCKPVIISLLPFKNYKIWNGISEKYRIQINNMLSQLDYVDFIDVTEIISEKDKTSIKASYTNDYLHLNEEGGKVLGNYLSSIFSLKNGFTDSTNYNYITDS